ncbi:MAG TPA: dephospho-CoA kinase [Verrucomicrobia bacterium]|nr:MAG: dephospho-CoA kinase [Lentisphaerae bacterium GWF2_57_35]HBA84965.1 dephospho-CoA kinase [Verrucomicrobiota bacterium]
MKPTDLSIGFCLALTGGLACGKSEAGRILERKGAVIWDADQAAHKIMAPGTEVYKAIVGRFGREVVKADGSLNREELGRRVFGQPTELKALNAIVHPAVLTQMHEWKDKAKRLQLRAVAIVPLLFEAGVEKGWDAVISIGASRDVVMKRLETRGLLPEAAEQRLAAQMPVEVKMQRADYAVWNDGTLAELEDKLMTIWLDILRNKKEIEHHG